MKGTKEVGWLSKNIIDALGIKEIDVNSSVFLGESNIKHMETKHFEDYKKYKEHISDIINAPDYGYLNDRDNSIELIKEFKVNNEFVRVALRITNKKVLYLRTLFIISNAKMLNYIKSKKIVKF